MTTLKDQWNSGDPYEYFMGRWSSLMAHQFMSWLSPAIHLDWLDIGCGTGALSEAIGQSWQPNSLSGIDPSDAFIAKARNRIHNRGDFKVGDVENMPFSAASFDVLVSGIALNFFPDLGRAFAEIKRVAKPGATFAAYVWDYAGRMDFLRYFWDAAYRIDPSSQSLDEGIRFPICNEERLMEAFEEGGLKEIKFAYLDMNTSFKNFDDFWNPFLGGQGPAPSYLASLSTELHEALKDQVYKSLPIASDGRIDLLGRALAIQGRIN